MKVCPRNIIDCSDWKDWLIVKFLTQGYTTQLPGVRTHKPLALSTQSRVSKNHFILFCKLYFTVSDVMWYMLCVSAGKIFLFTTAEETWDIKFKGLSFRLSVPTLHVHSNSSVCNRQTLSIHPCIHPI